MNGFCSGCGKLYTFCTCDDDNSVLNTSRNINPLPPIQTDRQRMIDMGYGATAPHPGGFAAPGQSPFPGPMGGPLG